jgi:hypothetical protein
MRETGVFRVSGSRAGDTIEVEFRTPAGHRAGRGAGEVDGTHVDLKLELLEEDGTVHSRGRLVLEAPILWLASKVLKTSRTEMDHARALWYFGAFDDGDWEEITLPDDNSFGEQTERNRLYRARFHLEEPTDSMNLVFSSDDGIWIYVNGNFLGHWGAKENKPGCVNDPLNRCGIDGTIPAVPIPIGFLKAGANSLAVKFNNGEC